MCSSTIAMLAMRHATAGRIGEPIARRDAVSACSTQQRALVRGVRMRRLPGSGRCDAAVTCRGAGVVPVALPQLPARHGSAAPILQSAARHVPLRNVCTITAQRLAASRALRVERRLHEVPRNRARCDQRSDRRGDRRSAGSDAKQDLVGARCEHAVPHGGSSRTAPAHDPGAALVSPSRAFATPRETGQRASGSFAKSFESGDARRPVAHARVVPSTASLTRARRCAAFVPRVAAVASRRARFATGCVRR